MSTQSPKSITIIGAGLSGLCLALALHRQSIPCTIYELRPENYSVGGGGIMLSPNALRIFDHLGVWDRVKTKGFHFETLAFMTPELEIKERFWFGDKKLFGYPGLRIFRQPLIDTFREMVHEAGVPIHYNAKFSHVVSESADEVVIAFADGTTMATPLLAGADGIHSKVRRYLYPNVELEFGGFVAVTGATPAANLRIPPGTHVPTTIISRPGAFVIAPQDVDGSDMFFGMQLVTHDRSREEWDALWANKAELASILRRDYDERPDVVKSVLDNIQPERLNIWPFYAVPKLDRWFSTQSRVVILGDAAHGLPPTSGQGVNQAFEDAYMLSQLLPNVSETIPMEKALNYWVSARHERLEGILRMTKLMNAKRLPPEEQAKLAKEDIWSGTGDPTEGGAAMKWLYGPDLKVDVENWVQAQSK